MSYQHRSRLQPRVLDADKARTASVLSGFKNDQSCKLSGKEIYEDRRSP